MSKKKNTLKNLDEFLKQQAANLVSPERLTDRLTAPAATTKHVAASTVEPQTTTIVHQLKDLIEEHGMIKFYETLIQTLDSPNTSQEEMMLINTALYLKHGDAWQEAIRDYWRTKA